MYLIQNWGIPPDGFKKNPLLFSQEPFLSPSSPKLWILMTFEVTLYLIIYWIDESNFTATVYLVIILLIKLRYEEKLYDLRNFAKI